MQVREKAILYWFEENLRELVPNDWKTSLSYQTLDAGRSSLWDAMLAIRAPDGTEAVVPIEVKVRPTPKEAVEIAGRISDASKSGWGESGALVVSEYLSPRAREACARAGLGYADRTGAWRLQLRSPSVYITKEGAQRNPNPQSRGIESFRGTTAARVARALVDSAPPVSLRMLGARAGVSPASVSKMLFLLAEESLIAREPRGPVDWADWPGIIQRWVQDYKMERSNQAFYFLSARGIDASLNALKKTAEPYAITGSVAADRALRALPEPRLIVYGANLQSLRTTLRLNQIDKQSANVVLLMPYDERVLEESEKTNDLAYAPWSQVLADLLTGVDREPSAGESLMDWMRDNEEQWRRGFGAD